MTEVSTPLLPPSHPLHHDKSLHALRLGSYHNPSRVQIRMKTRQARRKVTASTKKVSRDGVRRRYDALLKRGQERKERRNSSASCYLEAERSLKNDRTQSGAL